MKETNSNILLCLYNSAALRCNKPSIDSNIAKIILRENNNIITDINGIHIGIDFSKEPLNTNYYIKSNGIDAFNRAMEALQYPTNIVDISDIDQKELFARLYNNALISQEIVCKRSDLFGYVNPNFEECLRIYPENPRIYSINNVVLAINLSKGRNCINPVGYILANGRDVFEKSLEEARDRTKLKKEVFGNSNKDLEIAETISYPSDSEISPSNIKSRSISSFLPIRTESGREDISKSLRSI